MVVALIQRGEVSLTRWLPYVPCRGVQAQSKQRRLSRWLRNSRLNVHRLYKPLIQAALAGWAEDCLYLSLDTSLFWDEYGLVRLAVVHRGRALPVVWRVLKHGSASVAFEAYREMLHQAAYRLPLGVKVVVLADRGFVHTDAMTAMTTQLGWHLRHRPRTRGRRHGQTSLGRPPLVSRQQLLSHRMRLGQSRFRERVDTHSPGSVHPQP